MDNYPRIHYEEYYYLDIQTNQFSKQTPQSTHPSTHPSTSPSTPPPTEQNSNSKYD
jgi:hypothetical protein